MKTGTKITLAGLIVALFLAIWIVSEGITGPVQWLIIVATMVPVGIVGNFLEKRAGGEK